jgi:hypothetical protein
VQKVNVFKISQNNIFFDQIWIRVSLDLEIITLTREDLIVYRGQAFLWLYDSAPRPPPPPPFPVFTLSLFLSLPVCHRSIAYYGRGGGRGRAWSRIKKAWASINHSILSDCDTCCLFSLVNAIFCFTAVYFNIKNRPHHIISKDEAKVRTTLRVQHGSVGSLSSCCKAVPSSILGSAHQLRPSQR